MYNLIKTGRECKAELDAIGIPTGDILYWKVNSKAKSFWGRCRLHPNGKYTIEINSDLMNEENPLSALKKVIYHELLHTVKGCMNHGEKWKVLANQVNQALGVDIKRGDSVDDLNVKAYTTRKKVYHHSITCTDCNSTWNYQKMCRVVESAEHGRAKCSCGGRNFIVVHF